MREEEKLTVEKPDRRYHLGHTDINGSTVLR
jgi:hypothetical protein